MRKENESSMYTSVFLKRIFLYIFLSHTYLGHNFEPQYSLHVYSIYVCSKGKDFFINFLLD